MFKMFKGGEGGVMVSPQAELRNLILEVFMKGENRKTDVT